MFFITFGNWHFDEKQHTALETALLVKTCASTVGALFLYNTFIYMCFNVVLLKNDDGSGTVGASFLYKSFIHMLQI